MSPDLVALDIADDPAAWEALGFTVEDGVVRLGEVELRLRGRDAGRGLYGWVLDGATSTDLDGLETTLEDRAGRLRRRRAPERRLRAGSRRRLHARLRPHRSRRSRQAASTCGGSPRSASKYAPVRRGFYKLGKVVLEVVDQVKGPSGEDVDPSGPAFFWGIAVTASDVDGVAEQLGDATSGARDAVQPGRRIVPLRRAAGLALPMAFMSPEPARR